MSSTQGDRRVSANDNRSFNIELIEDVYFTIRKTTTWGPEFKTCSRKPNHAATVELELDKKYYKEQYGSTKWPAWSTLWGIVKEEIEEES